MKLNEIMKLNSQTTTQAQTNTNTNTISVGNGLNVISDFK